MGTGAVGVSLTVADASLDGQPAVLQRVCRAATTSLSLAGAVVQLITASEDAVVLASSDAAGRRLGEMPFEVGEGPHWTPAA